MTTSYPGALDSLTNPTTADNLNSPSHAGQHANANDAIEAIEAELGTDPAGAYTDVKTRLNAFSRYVPLDTVSVPLNTSTTTPITSTALELTAVPSSGVVAVHFEMLCHATSIGTGNSFQIYGYQSNRSSLQATGTVLWPVVSTTGVRASTGGVIATGGTNNRSIAYTVAVAAGTVEYILRVFGYWTTA